MLSPPPLLPVRTWDNNYFFSESTKCSTRLPLICMFYKQRSLEIWAFAAIKQNQESWRYLQTGFIGFRLWTIDRRKRGVLTSRHVMRRAEVIIIIYGLGLSVEFWGVNMWHQKLHWSRSRALSSMIWMWKKWYCKPLATFRGAVALVYRSLLMDTLTTHWCSHHLSNLIPLQQ